MGSGGEAHESAGTGGARRERSANAEGGQGAEARRGVHMWGWERGRSASACRGQTCKGGRLRGQVSHFVFECVCVLL